MHLHVTVSDLGQTIGFFETLFGASPALRMGSYAKWRLNDRQVNFGISTRGRTPYFDHVSIQVASADELQELAGRLNAAGASTFDDEGTTCCYARSDKSWASDPPGLHWESFFTFGEAITYDEDTAQAALKSGACCGAAKKPTTARC